LDYQGKRPDDYIPKSRTGVVIGRGDHPIEESGRACRVELVLR
jgi:hypothetical protein